MEDQARVALIRKKYQEFNNKYFNDRLPQKVEILVGDYLEDYSMITAKVPANGRPGRFHIWVDQSIDDLDLLDMHLLHEMVHIDGWDRHRGHGKEFDKAMLRLAKMGAFNGRW